MIKTLVSALFRGGDTQRLTQFKPPDIVEVSATKKLLINPEHYRQYCSLVDWNEKSSLHPLYLQMMSFDIQMQCLADKRNPFPLLGLVHRTNEVWQSATIDLQVRFNLNAQLGELKAHPKGWEIDVIVEASQQGKCVYKAKGTYLIRINAPHVAKLSGGGQGARQPFWEHYQPVSEWQVPADMGRKYAKISHDYNPIHLSAISAKMFGFKQAIAHGMWSLAKCFSQLAEQKNSTNEDVQLDAEFLRPIFLPAACVLFKDADAEKTQFALINTDRNAPHIRGKLN